MAAIRLVYQGEKPVRVKGQDGKLLFYASRGALHIVPEADTARIERLIAMGFERQEPSPPAPLPEGEGGMAGEGAAEAAPTMAAEAGEPPALPGGTA